MNGEKNKFYTSLTYFDIETGEVLKKHLIQSGKYYPTHIKQINYLKTKDYVEKQITRGCRKTNQTEIKF